MESGLPKHFTEESKALKDCLTSAAGKAEFLSEFKTVNVVKEQPMLSSSSVLGSSKFTVEDTTTLLVGAKQLLKESYDLKRQEARKAVTFLLSNTDRMGDVYEAMACYPGGGGYFTLGKTGMCASFG